MRAENDDRQDISWQCEACKNANGSRRKEHKTHTQTKTLTMKTFTDYITNTITTTMTVGAAAILMRGVHEYTSLKEVWTVPPVIQTTFLFVTSTLCVMNITGIISAQRKLWEGSFGDRFLPNKMATAKKRQLVGLVELVGVVLGEFGVTHHLRAIGFAILMVMYGRGGLVHMQLSGFKALLALTASVVAGCLMLEHVHLDEAGPRMLDTPWAYYIV